MVDLRGQRSVDVLFPTQSGGALNETHSTAGLSWLFERRELLGLSMDDVGQLLGGISQKTLEGWQSRLSAGEAVEVSQDVIVRISLLLGIHKALSIITPSDHERLAYEWFQKPLDLIGLQGRSIREYVLEHGSIDGLYFVRRNLDAMCV